MRIRHALLLKASLFVVAATLPTTVMAAVVHGTVTDAQGIARLQGAEVTIPALGRTAVADGRGSFRIPNVPVGTYEVHVRFAGAEAEVHSITVTEDQQSPVRFALRANDTEMDTILVVGQQANMLSSISRQRAADTVVTVLSRDAMGQFPDQNVAESLRRAPGINVVNDQGEGRFVAVRGLDPNLNSTSINGARVPATGGADRMVAMDVIPSELVESIEIKKSLTPDMDGDTIGGSIDITTTSAFDREKGFVNFSVEGSYNKLSDAYSPKIGGNFSTRLTDNLGVTGGFSWNRRQFSTDNIEVGDWTANDDGMAYAETIEYRDYDVERVRWGGNLSIDYRASDTTNLYVRGLYSKFDDSELRTRLVFKPSEAPATAWADGFGFDSADGRIEVRRDLKDRREWQTTTTVVAGGDTEFDAWTLNYQASWSRAEQREDGSIDPIRFRQRFSGEGALGVDFDFSNWQRPSFGITQGADAFNDPAGYNFSLLEYTIEEDAVDTEWAFKTDIARSFELGAGEFELKWGGKARFRDKHQYIRYGFYDDLDGSSLNLGDVAGAPSYGLADIGVVPDLGKVQDWFDNNAQHLVLNELDTALANSAENFRIKEDVLATYLQGRYQNDVWRLVGGVRIEHTEVGMSGSRVDLVAEGGSWNGAVLAEDSLFVTPLQLSQSYTDILPSLNIRANVADNLVARAGVYKSLSRPSFGKMAPIFSVEENDAGEREGVFGNPELKPYQAWNADATLEYYFAPKAVVQAGVFWKSINNFIVDANFRDGTFQGVPYNEATIAINGDNARVLGLEVSYSQAFTGLPAPFDGLLTQLNYTMTDTKATLFDRRQITLPNASKHTFNAVLGYDKGAFSFRVAGAFRDGYLDQLGATPNEDRFVRSHFQLDLSAKLKVTDNVQLFADLVNLNNAKYVAYQNGPSQRQLLQYEEYKWTAKFGAKVNF